MPLPLRMQAAAVLLGPPNDPWEENERRAALARGEDPADPAAALMWAMTRYARLMFPPDWAAADLEGYGAVQEEIEGLVFASLQAARGDPILSVAAAQLLLWTGRGHMDLAEELAQAALSSTTAFAAALPVLGQVRGYRGDTDVALRLFDEARALAEPGSEFEVYLLVLRCRMLLARGDAEALRAQLAELDRIKPATRAQLALPTVLAGDGGLSREAREQLAALDPEAARIC